MDQFSAFLENTFGDRLRSVTYYDQSSVEYVYLRDGVLEAYTEETVDQIVNDLRLESMGKPVEESRFNHGDLQARVSCFENGTEMNFAFGKGEGVVVGLERGALVTEGTFIGRCLDELGTPEQ
ncbi:MAG: hypothetical protein U5K37_12335 [Natrialbaceae archaeon]|nr:hypothetical protein [Natrialbaceae archaeon]